MLLVNSLNRSTYFFLVYMLLHFLLCIFFNHTAILKRFVKIKKDYKIGEAFGVLYFLATAFKIDVKLCRECATCCSSHKKKKITDAIGNQIGKEF